MSFQRITRGPMNGPVLFFLHGWPDSAELWENQLDYFSKNFFCIAITLPDFDGKTTSSYNYPRLVAKIVEEIKATGRQQVILVGHDWGAYIAYLKIGRAHV